MLHFIDVIFSIVWNVSNWLYERAMVIPYIPFLHEWLRDTLISLSDRVYSMLEPIAHFYAWIADVSAWIENILGYWDIWLWFEQWFNWAEWAWSWVSNSLSNVWFIVDEWWADTRGDVQRWITTATEGLNDLLIAWDNFWTITWPEWMSNFDSLANAWDEFWTVTFPTLVSFTWLAIWWNERVKDIERFINTAFTDREPWWSGWQEKRDEVFEFFNDPLEWLWTRFTEWFLGPEE